MNSINVSGTSRWVSKAADAYEGGIGDEVVAQFKTREEAHLWRAAPYMRAALEALMREHDALVTAKGHVGDRWPLAMGMARIAIAKSKGNP